MVSGLSNMDDDNKAYEMTELVNALQLASQGLVFPR